VKKKRPYVICHMTPSIDGRIVPKNWPSLKIASAAYERTATTLDADAWILLAFRRTGVWNAGIS
jgi:2,5-diamino-6-(ribosylamino)-4(3H)-pyrimidinone 5'-phosphate reductase